MTWSGEGIVENKDANCRNKIDTYSSARGYSGRKKKCQDIRTLKYFMLDSVTFHVSLNATLTLLTNRLSLPFMIICHAVKFRYTFSLIFCNMIYIRRLPFTRFVCLIKCKIKKSFSSYRSPIHI